MRHLNTGRKLGVDSSHRIALMRSLTLALIEKESIRTLPSRAKELRWYAERIVTLAKRGDLGARRRIVQLLGSTRTAAHGKNRVRAAVDKVYSQLVPRFKDRPGGYTQILKLAQRRAGDNAELCVMRYLPPVEEKKTKSKAPSKPSKKGKTPLKAKASAKEREKAESKGGSRKAAKDKAKTKDKQE